MLSFWALKGFNRTSIADLSGRQGPLVFREHCPMFRFAVHISALRSRDGSPACAVHGREALSTPTALNAGGYRFPRLTTLSGNSFAIARPSLASDVSFRGVMAWRSIHRARERSGIALQFRATRTSNRATAFGPATRIRGPHHDFADRVARDAGQPVPPMTCDVPSFPFPGWHHAIHTLGIRHYLPR